MVEYFEFEFEGKKAKCTYDAFEVLQGNDILRAEITCDHPIFINTFGLYSILRSNFEAMIEEGLPSNKEFFDEMYRGYKYRS